MHGHFRSIEIARPVEGFSFRIYFLRGQHQQQVGETVRSVSLTLDSVVPWSVVIQLRESRSSDSERNVKPFNCSSPCPRAAPIATLVGPTCRFMNKHRFQRKVFRKLAPDYHREVVRCWPVNDRYTTTVRTHSVGLLGFRSGWLHVTWNRPRQVCLRSGK